MNVYDILKELNSTSKKNDKLAIIKEHANNDVFVKILSFTYDKLSTNYYVKKLLPVNSIGISTLDDNIDALDALLNDLSSRKITGNTALNTIKLFMENYTSESQDIITKIIKRDLKCGFSESSINKAIPNLIPTFDVALAQSYKDHASKVWDIKKDWYVSRKMDGLRNICKKIDGKFSFYSRKGKPFFTLNNLIPELEILTEGIDNIVFDGEACIMNGDVEDFKAISSEYNKKNHRIEHPMYKIFDVLTVEEFESKTSTRTFLCRYVHLQQLFLKILPSKFSTLSMVKQTKITKENFEQMKLESKDKGWEGLIFRLDCRYNGKRSADILKYKLFRDEEWVVNDIETGEYTYTEKGVGQVTETMMLRANIIIDGEIVKGKHNVGVGSGWSIDQRKEYMKHPENIIGKTITVQFFEHTLNDQGGESLRFPTVKHVYENGRDV